jgi:hypothetical protein
LKEAVPVFSKSKTSPTPKKEGAKKSNKDLEIQTVRNEV